MKAYFVENLILNFIVYVDTNFNLVYFTIILIDSEFPSIADHFAFGYKTKKSHDPLNFSFSLLDEKGKLKWKKVSVLSFKIQIIKW